MGTGDDGDVAVLHCLHTQLRLLAAAMTVDASAPEVTAMLAGLADTTAAASAVLAVAEPGTLDVLGRAFAYAKARRHDESATELVAAHGRLSLLLRET
ncbi:hypothetical protein FPZ12_025090 [Amycolatopsis acidicola]|uniref:Uncharacterized protein n=1 Tax=Amycolatopsis acidicola TaxID=2596893 RepID=A0A5N0UXX0_9PSEU|nr:hypothetical protein [Amycolatopsis acidicola]KAA9157450.1 hypothetical protein FPZ12_025090 [Amycolatopsis acidicola]